MGRTQALRPDLSQTLSIQDICRLNLCRVQDLLDVNSITTNDVGAILRTLGVEAARATVVAEVVKVFGVYGIAVDRRHLGLIGDFMTHQARPRELPCTVAESVLRKVDTGIAALSGGIVVQWPLYVFAVSVQDSCMAT